MKKNYGLTYIVVVFMVLTRISALNAVEWEGIGEVSTDGELPAEGYYAAIDTNNVPLNTIIYIKNLETEKMIPVTVVKGLENPSLVALLSKDAAQAIGMRGSKSRILMTEQEVAYPYFTNPGSLFKGDDATSESVSKTPNQPLSDAAKEVASDDTLPSKSSRSPGPNAKSSTQGPSPAPPSNNQLAADPKTSGEDSATANAKPEVTIPSPAPNTGNGIKVAEKPTARIEEPKVVPEKESITNRDKAPQANTIKPTEMVKIEKPAEPVTLEEFPQIIIPGKIPNSNKEEGVKVTEKPVLEKSVVTPETSLPGGMGAIANADRSPDIREKPSITEGKEGSYDLDKYDLALVPTEKRPPQERTNRTIPSEYEIAPIPANTSRGSGSALPSNAEIAPIAPRGLPPESEIPAISSSTPAITRSSGLPAEAEIIPIESMPPRIQAEDTRLSQTNPVPQNQVVSPEHQMFSVPLINTLERGKYYLQLLALSKPEMVELELSKIGRSYPLAIQNVGNASNPVYRILLGPVNRGESGALLAYFKNFGYRDAFVRQGS